MTEIPGEQEHGISEASSSGHSGNITTVHESSPEYAVLGIVQRCYMNLNVRICHSMSF